MSKPDYFMFLDIETSGLDPAIDLILEVAWVITDNEFKAVTPPRSFVVKQEENYGARLATAAQVVIDMHTANGLLAEVDFAKEDLDDVWMQMHDDLSSVSGEIQLAGRTIQFDDRFLRKNHFGPLFEEKMSHRMYDLRSVRTYLDLKGIEYDDIQGQNHRALDDVLNDIEFARHLQTLVVY